MGKNVLFEIGLEELPARFVDQTEKQLADETEQWLNELRISYSSIKSFSTPRRLAILIKNISETQTSLDVEVKGPSEKIAKESDGSWSKAALGFTKGQGKTPEDIYSKEVKGTPYIYVNKFIEGEKTFNLLPTFKKVIESLQFPSNMKWGTGTMRFARPIRWLVALYDKEVIPFEVANVTTQNITYGHRFLGQQVKIENPLYYEELLNENYVIVNSVKRKELIENGIKQLENQHSYIISVDQGLLNEVKNLVEYPTVFMGSFDDQYLKLPTEVLVISMKEHQRYFYVEDKDGNLLPYFIGVRNGDDYKLDNVIKGNEKVLHARLADAQFFYEEDNKHTIEYYQNKLRNVIFQEKLGTISDKVKRIRYITKEIATRLSLSEEELQKADRAAEICKFDLTTNMVNEFTELQGIIGEKYAMNFGEDEIVAKAVREHYLPNHAAGELPESLIGAIVSLADKLDTIVGTIYIGLTPTSSHDPYGLRRQTIGVLRILEAWKWDISVRELFNIPFELYNQLALKHNVEINAKEILHEFIKYRVMFLLKERQIEPDVMEAVLNRGVENLPYLMNKARIISSKRNDDRFKIVQEALVRVLNLAKKASDVEIDPTLFETEAEQKLFDVLQEVTQAYGSKNNEKDASEALSQLSQLAKPIHDFFDTTMVMVEDKQVRDNRLGLINRISELVKDYADLSEVEWKQNF